MDAVQQQLPSGFTPSSPPQRKPCINRKLIQPKLLLITFYGALGCLAPFLTLHMQHLGLNHEEITWINAVLPVTSLFGPPLAGYVADRSGKHKLITILSMILGAVFYMLLLFVPPTEVAGGGAHMPGVELWCGPNGSHLSVPRCPHEEAANSNPCQRAQTLGVPVTAAFSISNCYYHCENSTSGFFHDDDPSPPPENSVGDSGDRMLPLPGGEVSTHSEPPHLCLVDASKAEQCVYLHHSNSSFTFNRSLDLDNAQPGFTSRGEAACVYKQGVEGLSSDLGYFEHLICHTEGHCQVLCDATEDNNGKKWLSGPAGPGCSSARTSRQLTYWLYFLIRALADLFPAILISLLDAVVLTLVTQHGGDFGRQKMFGLVAVGVTAPLVGLLMDGDVVAGRYNYGPVFYAFAAFMVLSAFITATLPLHVEVRTTSLLKSLSLLFKNTELVALFFVMALLGSFWSYLEIFIYIYLKSLEAPNILIGLTITIGIVPSIPFLFKSDSIMRCCGHHNVLIVAFIMYSVRFVGFAHMYNAWWALPLEALELFTLNLMQVAAATLAFKLAPKTLVATAQALLWIAHFTIGRCLGAMVSGKLIEVYGMTRVFQGASVVAAICAATYFTLYHLCRWHTRRSGRGPGQQAATQQQMLPPQDNAPNGTLSNGTYRPIPLDDKL